MRSLAILLTTIGKETLRDMLDSLVDQLNKNDYLYVVVDGSSYFKKSKEILEEYIDKFKCNFNVIYNKKNLGFWGHGIRNKYQSELNGDFILHADDDDVYIEGSIDIIRNYIKDSDYNTILFFKFYQNFNDDNFYWKTPILEDSNIGTPCGVIPNVPNKMGKWEHRYGGDFNFYSTCKFNHKFIDEFIYCANPRKNGFCNKNRKVIKGIDMSFPYPSIDNMCVCGEPKNRRISNFCKKCNRLY